MNTYPEAVSIVVLNQDGRILACSRTENPGKWGLPGGKVEPQETPLEAAVRELLEETGLDVPEEEFAWLLSGPCPDESGRLPHPVYQDTTFLVECWEGEPRQMEPGVQVEWLTWKELQAGPFGLHNREIEAAYLALQERKTYPAFFRAAVLSGLEEGCYSPVTWGISMLSRQTDPPYLRWVWQHLPRFLVDIYEAIDLAPADDPEVVFGWYALRTPRGLSSLRENLMGALTAYLKETGKLSE